MHKLTKTSFFVVVLACFLIIASIFTSFYVLNYEVENVIKSVMEVDYLNNKKIYLNSNHGYLVKKDSLINVSINNKYYQFQIENISFDKQKKLFVLKVLNKEIELLKSSTLQVKIIYQTNSLFDVLFNN